MNEAETRIAQTILPREWTWLRDVVCSVTDFFKRDLGLVMINRYLHEELLELALVASDGTMTEFSREDRERRTVHAAFFPAEGVWVEPHEDGQHFARLAKLPSPATATPPADRPMAPAEESMPEPAPTQQSPPQQWDPQTEWSVETVFRELGIKGRQQQVIVPALPKIYGDSIVGELNRLIAKTPFKTAELRNAIGALLEKEAGKKLRAGEIPSWDACKDFLTAWHAWRARRL